MRKTRRPVSGAGAGLLLALMFPALCQGEEEVRAWEGTIAIPTYGWQEDVNPKFWAMEGAAKGSTTVHASIIYPYTMQDHLFRTKQDRTYKALFLENEFLKVTCLPELGGRLHSVLDKTEGKETFHLNSVIKPSMIAMRGAFISGGVEWNAGPQVHTVTIVSPVTAFVGRLPGGEAYIEISNLEKSLRTRWTVRVTLHPGKAYLDEEIRIENPVDAFNPYYFWNCTAFPCRPGTRFIFPMTLGTDHYGIRFFHWPVHEGQDLSWLRNHEIWASVFAVNCVFDFFGAYDAEADRGVVQVANHHELSGKKAWTWGTWDFGLKSQENLTDEDGPYIEVQSGPLPTQSDYGMLAPHESIAWREWWYPVHGLGDGFEYATRDVAVQRVEKNGALELRLLGTGRHSDLQLTITKGTERLLAQRIDLTPQAPSVVTLRPAPAGPVGVTLTTRDGRLLARFFTPLPVPGETPPHPDALKEKGDEELTLEETYLRGLRFDRATNRPKAREYYKKVLGMDGSHRGALRSLAALDLEAGLYAEALERLEKALARKPDDDGLSWYLRGVCHLRLGAYQEALRCGYRAARCFGTVGLGYDLAGRACMRRGEIGAARRAFEKASRAAPDSRIARDHLKLACYAGSKAERKPFDGFQWPENAGPSRPIARAIRAFRDEPAMERFVLEMRSSLGEIDFEMIEAAVFFAELGLVEEAAALLTRVCIDPVPQEKRSPLPLYYAAYYAHLDGDEEGAEQRLKEAAAARRDFVFPSRTEAVNVFAYALKVNQDDAHAHLHLGNLYGGLGRLGEAVVHWRRAVDLNPDFSIAWRNLGLYWWTEGDDLECAEACYRKAIAARPSDQTLYRDLGEVLLDGKNRPEAIKVLETMPFEKMRRADITIMLARAYLDAGRYSDAIDLLAATPYFVNWEGSTVTRSIFCEARMKRGRERFEAGYFEEALADFNAALTYPENLGVGRSNAPEEAAACYWQGMALHALGREQEANAAWRTGAEGAEGSADQNRHRELCEKALQ